MSTAVFPTSTQIPGVDIKITKRVEWDTIVQEAVSGLETRVARRVYPRREWDLQFNFLRSSSANLEFQNLESFFDQRQGMFDSFCGLILMTTPSLAVSYPLVFRGY